MNLRYFLTTPPRALPTLVTTVAWVSALALILTFFSPSTAAADGIIIPEPPRDRPLRWREIPLAIKYHHVTVEIAQQVATTHVDQVFVNEADFAIEGVYIFPLPEDAAVSSFDMWVDGQPLEGRLMGKDEARALYEEIVRTQQDPALLEYAGRGAFKASIFPIPPGAERRVRLVYTQVLKQEAGLVHYRYGLNTEKFSARPLEDVSISVSVRDAAPVRTIYSPSHAVDVARVTPNHVAVSYEAQQVRPDRDFDLYYSLATDTIAAHVLSYKPFDDDGFFLLLLTPPLSAPQAVVAKDVIMVLDTSGSMEGEKLAQAKAAAGYVLDHLAAQDRFNIIAFSAAPKVFSPQPAPLARRDEARAFVSRLTAAGSTDINRALLEASAAADAERPTVLIFLTDGLPTAGETNPDRILANVAAQAPASVRLFAFGVGYDVDVPLLDELSANQRGASSYVRPGEAIDEVVSGFYARISAPVLVDLDLDLTGVVVEDLYPYPLPDLFEGAQLMVVGRYRQGGAAQLTLSGVINDAPQRYRYDDLRFVTRGGDPFIAQLWAQRKIGYLLTQIRLKGASAELVDEVVSLSIRYGIVTPYTSFLVEEPALALSADGREALARTLQAPGADQGAAAATGAPQPQRSGEAAVAKAVTEKALKSSEQVDAAPAQVARQVKQVAGKTFLFDGQSWIDTTFDAARMPPEVIPFGSDRYFEALQAWPALAPYLALGERVIVVLDGRAFAVGPAGPAFESPPVTPAPPTAPLVPPTPAEPAAGPRPQLCVSAPVIGALGLLLPLAQRKRSPR